MQHGTGTLHNTQNRKGKEKPHVEKDNRHDDTEDACSCERVAERHVPEHD